MPDSAAFEFACGQLETGTSLDRLAARGTVRIALKQAGLEARIQGFPQIFNVALGVSTPIRNYRDARAADRAAYVALTTALLGEGVRALERGAWFMSAAHDDAVLDRTLTALERAVRR